MLNNQLQQRCQGVMLDGQGGATTGSVFCSMSPEGEPWALGPLGACVYDQLSPSMVKVDLTRWVRSHGPELLEGWGQVHENALHGLCLLPALQKSFRWEREFRTGDVAQWYSIA